MITILMHVRTLVVSDIDPFFAIEHHNTSNPDYLKWYSHHTDTYHEQREDAEKAELNYISTDPDLTENDVEISEINPDGIWGWGSEISPFSNTVSLDPADFGLCYDPETQLLEEDRVYDSENKKFIPNSRFYKARERAMEYAKNRSDEYKIYFLDLHI